ncbi:MAG: thioesterase [Treponema sp.]|nr:thioesterase [Treponema sp.]
MVDIWREKINVRFGSVDRSDRLTLASIFDFFQEAAISHAENIGVGRDAFDRSGQAWVLSRISLFVERRPAFGETVEMSTWPRGWEKLFALRDYEIRDARGTAIVRGRGSWLALDVEKRRPLRAQSIIITLPENPAIDAFPAGSAALNQRENLTKKTDRTACYSDIDYYSHVNNTRYVQWIQDITDVDVLTNADQIRLDINYLSEVKPGETVELWSGPLESAVPEAAGNPADYPRTPGPAFACEGRRMGSGQAVFRAELRTGI